MGGVINKEGKGGAVSPGTAKHEVMKLYNMFVFIGVSLMADPEEVARFLGDLAEEDVEEHVTGEPITLPNEPLVAPEGGDVAVRVTEQPLQQPEMPMGTPEGGVLDVRVQEQPTEGASGSASWWDPMEQGSGSYAGGGRRRDLDPTIQTSGGRSTPLGNLLGLTLPPARAQMLCDDQFINWPLPDQLLSVHFVVPPPMFALPSRIRKGEIKLDSDMIIIAIGTVDKLAKATVITWVQDMMDSIRQCNPNAEVFLGTALPQHGENLMKVVNYNRNIAAGIRRWNRHHPHTCAKYIGWHKVLLKEEYPEDGVWERPALYLIREELRRVARI